MTRRPTNEWAVEQLIKARRCGLNDPVQMLANLERSIAGAQTDIAKYWPSRNGDWRHRRYAVKGAIATIRQCRFLQAWLPTQDVAADKTVYLRWVTARTEFPVLCTPQGAIARLCRGQFGRGFRYEIFSSPRPLTGALYEMLSVDDPNVWRAQEYKYRKQAVAALIEQVRCFSMALFGANSGNNLDIPPLQYDGRWWRTE